MIVLLIINGINNPFHNVIDDLHEFTPYTILPMETQNRKKISIMF